MGWGASSWFDPSMCCYLSMQWDIHLIIHILLRLKSDCPSSPTHRWEGAEEASIIFLYGYDKKQNSNTM